MDRFKVDTKPLIKFQNELLQALGSYLPTLAVRTGHTNTTTPLTANMELACRKIPVLMLDPQIRKWPGDVVQNDTHSDVAREDLITKAIELNLARNKALWDAGKVAAYDQHDLAYFFAVLRDDGNADHIVHITNDSMEDGGSLYESIQSAEKAVRNAGQTFTPAQMERVIDHLVDMMAETCWRILPAAKQAKIKADHPDCTPQSESAHVAPRDITVTARMFVTVCCLVCKCEAACPRARQVTSPTAWPICGPCTTTSCSRATATEPTSSTLTAWQR